MLVVEECADSASYIDQEHVHDIRYPGLMSNYQLATPSKQLHLTRRLL